MAKKRLTDIPIGTKVEVDTWGDRLPGTICDYPDWAKHLAPSYIAVQLDDDKGSLEGPKMYPPHTIWIDDGENS